MRSTPAFLALLALVLTAGAASAQDATPGSDGATDGTPIVLPTGLPDTPDPARCTVQAPTIDGLLGRLGATPVPSAPRTGSPTEGDEEAPVATPPAFTLPDGEPADNPTVEAITALMLEVVACLNTGNVLTLFAFTSDAFLERVQATTPFTEEDAAYFEATPAARPAELYVTLVAVREVTVLPDGRVGALVDAISPDESAEVQTDYFLFVEEDGHWLIDEIVEDLEGRYPPEPIATPAA